MARVFVSHSSRDNAVAAEIKAWLTGQGFDNVFLDIDKHSGIAPGSNWERKLYREIDSSHAVILILTPNWLDSKWCFVEFAQARALGKAIFPVIVPPGGEQLLAPDIQHLDLRTDREGGLERLAHELTDLALNAQGGFHWDSHRPPYPGLMSFEADDAAIFFGRDDDIRRLIERLNARRVQGGPRLIVVLGASGSGKSSLLRAGVLPRLARDKRNWIVLPPLRPRLDPIAELARAAAERLGSLEDWKPLRERLASASPSPELESLAEKFRAKAASRDAQILVTIDQAEELFAVTEPARAEEFWRLLKTITEEGSPFIVLMSLRSDYLGLVQKEAEGLMRFEEFSLGPMPLERLPQIIEGPARVAGLSVEDRLIAAAGADAGTEDALPLLAFTLRELYDRHVVHGERRLLLTHYRELGDVGAGLNPLENSVRKRADEVIAAANPTQEQLKALRAAFVGSLVRVNDKGEYVRQPARVSDLPADARPILAQLTDARLLVTRDVAGQTMIEVAHEALLRKWPRLRAWLDEEREFLIGKRRLEDAFADWEKATDADKPNALLHGLALDRAGEWLLDHPQALSDGEKGFIAASQERALKEKRRRLRNRVVLSAAGLAVAALVGLVLIGMRIEATRREALQRGIEATRLAFLSGSYLRANDVANAVNTGLTAEKTLSTPETRSALLQSLLAVSPHLARSLRIKDLRPFVLTALPGTEDVLVGGLTGTVEIWRPAGQDTSHRVAAFKSRDPAHNIKPAVQALAAANDQKAAAILSDGRLVAFNPKDGQELAKPALLAEDIDKAAIGATGKLLVAASQGEGGVSAFSCRIKFGLEESLACDKTPIASGFAEAVAVNEASQRAAVALEGNGLKLFDLAQTSAEAETLALPSTAPIRSLAFDARGERLAAGTAAGEAFVLDLKGNSIALPKQQSPVTALAFDADGSRLAGSCDGFAVCIWKLPKAGASGEAELLVTLAGHANTIVALSFGPGSDALVSADADETIKSWTIEAVDRMSFELPAPGRAALTDLGVSADRKWLAASNVAGGIGLWHLKSLAFARALVPLRDAEIRSLQWHPEKPLLVQTDQAGWLAIRPLPEEAEAEQIKIDPSGNTVAVARWLPDGNAIVAGLFGGEIKEWRPRAEPLAFAARHPDAVQGLAVDPGSGRLLSSDSLGNVWAWDLKSRKKVLDLPPAPAAQDVIDVTSGGRIALTAGNGGKITLYDLDDARIVRQLDVGAQSEGAGFSPDGKLIADADAEGKLHIWSFDGDNGSEVFASVKVYASAPEAAHLARLALVPELSAIAIATSRGEIKLVSYDVAAWRKRAASLFLAK